MSKSLEKFCWEFVLAFTVSSICLSVLCLTKHLTFLSWGILLHCFINTEQIVAINLILVKYGPLISQDLTCFDSFLWGYVKDCVYGIKINDFPELHLRIMDAVALVTLQMLTKHLENMGWASAMSQRGQDAEIYRNLRCIVPYHLCAS